MFSTLSLVAIAPSAAAKVKEGIGHSTTPGQPYGGKDRSSDWLGSYVVGDEQVFCVQFQYKAPDTNEKYEPGDELLTKFGEKLSDTVAANISYLLLRYGDTTSKHEAAALAHLLHSWTAAPRSEADLDPALGFKEIAYDAGFHLEKLPSAAQKAVQRLRADAEANRGPWESKTTAPADDRIIGTPGEWTIEVTNADGEGVGAVPVSLNLSDATLADGAESGTVTTDSQGIATVEVIPTGESPAVAGTFSAPADRPYVRFAVEANTQRVVSTGGEKEMTTKAATTARTPPGGVAVSKVDATSSEGIAGVELMVTGDDKKTAAIGQDEQPLADEEGKPIVVTTAGADGAVEIADLRTPQTVCVVEVSPPAGYEEAFDKDHPPSACGEVQPGETLTLEISNVPNAPPEKPEVPKVIPAGSEPTAVAQAATISGPTAAGLAGLGALALAGSALIGLLARRRLTGRETRH
ncbi:MAG: MSCRAMM family protein [Pseudonocardiaceae bacterium]